MDSYSFAFIKQVLERESSCFSINTADYAA